MPTINVNVLTRERLGEVISYDPEAGVFRWLRTLGSKAPAGSVAGSIGHYGYRTVRIDRRDYRARPVWRGFM